MLSSLIQILKQTKKYFIIIEIVHTFINLIPKIIYNPDYSFILYEL